MNPETERNPPGPNLNSLVRRLLRWYARSARDLPWRRTDDPYAVWVSEIMLQQTQVKTVLPYWERWMREFPTVKDLAQAPLDKVLKVWAGLGYYSRARNLRRAARIVLTQWNGRVPHGYSDLLALPGIGDYTAGAICSIAFNQPRPALDGNVIRVLRRLFSIREPPREKKARQLLEAQASDLVQRAAKITAFGNRPCAVLNQSLMELGATVCTPRQPNCPRCPVRVQCVAWREGTIDQLPKLRRHIPIQDRHWICFVVSRKDRFLLRRRPSGGLNARLWEFPNSEIAPSDLANPLAVAQSVLGFIPTEFKPLGVIQHRITRYRIRLSVFRVHAHGPLPVPLQDARWVRPDNLCKLALAGAHRRIASQLLGLSDY